MAPVKLDIRSRTINSRISILDIQGEVTGSAESILMDAYTQATASGAQAIILNFSGLEYMNSSGIGLLVTMLIRTQRQKQRLVAFGLSDHYRQIFELTQLDKAIGICGDEAAALAASDEHSLASTDGRRHQNKE
jgi:anti-sigma B factor antagonist